MNAYSAVAGPRHPSARGAAMRAVGALMLIVAERVMAARNRARTLRILSGLDDAALRVIGLSRGDFDAVERDPRYSAKFPGF